MTRVHFDTSRFGLAKAPTRRDLERLHIVNCNRTSSSSAHTIFGLLSLGSPVCYTACVAIVQRWIFLAISYRISPSCTRRGALSCSRYHLHHSPLCQAPVSIWTGAFSIGS